jgi:hypothetical protein
MDCRLAAQHAGFAAERLDKLERIKVSNKRLTGDRCKQVAISMGTLERTVQTVLTIKGAAPSIGYSTLLFQFSTLTL